MASIYDLTYPGTTGNGGLGFSLPSISSSNSSSDYLSSLSKLGGNGNGIPGFELGWNADTMKMGLGGLQALGSLYASLSALGLAKDQFNFTKDATNTNLNNSIKSYNTSLEDRATSRAVQNGTSAADLAAYLEKNRLTR